MAKKDKNRDNDVQGRLDAILNTTVDAVICIDSRGIIDLFNSSAEKMFGYSADEVIGKKINLLMPNPYASEHDQYIENYEKTGEKKIIGIGRELIAKHKNGESFPVELSISESRLNGRPLYTGFIRDLRRKARSELQVEQFQNYLKQVVADRTYELTEANKKLEELAKVDALTNIANRRYFNEALEKEILRACRNHSSISLIMCDIDYFKGYNDHYGHVEGDQCLQKVASCFRNTFERAMDLPARYGGEEFVVILPETSMENAQAMAGMLRQGVDNLHIPHAKSRVANHVTLSIGITCATPA